MPQGKQQYEPELDLLKLDEPKTQKPVELKGLEPELDILFPKPAPAVNPAMPYYTDRLRGMIAESEEAKRTQTSPLQMRAPESEVPAVGPITGVPLNTPSEKKPGIIDKLDRLSSAFFQSLNPMPLVEHAYKLQQEGDVIGMMDLVSGGLITNTPARLVEAKNRIKDRNWVAALSNVARAVPFFGPMTESVQEYLKEGKYAEATGALVGIATIAKATPYVHAKAKYAYAYAQDTIADIKIARAASKAAEEYAGVKAEIDQRKAVVSQLPDEAVKQAQLKILEAEDKQKKLEIIRKEAKVAAAKIDLNRKGEAVSEIVWPPKTPEDIAAAEARFRAAMPKKEELGARAKAALEKPQVEPTPTGTLAQPTPEKLLEGPTPQKPYTGVERRGPDRVISEAVDRQMTEDRAIRRAREIAELTEASRKAAEAGPFNIQSFITGYESKLGQGSFTQLAPLRGEDYARKIFGELGTTPEKLQELGVIKIEDTPQGYKIYTPTPEAAFARGQSFTPKGAEPVESKIEQTPEKSLEQQIEDLKAQIAAQTAKTGQPAEPAVPNYKVELNQVFETIYNDWPEELAKVKRARKFAIDDITVQPGQPLKIPATYSDATFRYTVLKHPDGTMEKGASGSYDTILNTGAAAAKEGTIAPGYTLYVIDLTGDYRRVRIYRSSEAGFTERIKPAELGPAQETPQTVVTAEQIDAIEKYFNKPIDDISEAEVQKWFSDTGTKMSSEGQTTKLDIQTGSTGPQPIAEQSPFRERPATTAGKRVLFEDNPYVGKDISDLLTQDPTNPTKDIEVTTSKLTNDVNRWLDGEDISIEESRNFLSDLSTHADEFRSHFDNAADFQFWKNTVSEAASWARKADRAKIQRTPPSLYSGLDPTEAAKMVGHWYSMLKKVAAEKLPNVAPVQQVINTLRKLVTNDEWKASQLDEFLANKTKDKGDELL